MLKKKKVVKKIKKVVKEEIPMHKMPTGMMMKNSEMMMSPDEGRMKAMYQARMKKGKYKK